MSRAPTHHWYFEGLTVAELLIRLDEAGPGAILRVWQEGDRLYLDVEPESLTGDRARRPIGAQPLNESHTCPGSPGCPG